MSDHYPEHPGHYQRNLSHDPQRAKQARQLYEKLYAASATPRPAYRAATDAPKAQQKER